MINPSYGFLIIRSVGYKTYTTLGGGAELGSSVVQLSSASPDKTEGSERLPP